MQLNDSTLLRTQCFVAGEWVPARDGRGIEDDLDVKSVCMAGIA